MEKKKKRSRITRDRCGKMGFEKIPKTEGEKKPEKQFVFWF